VQLCAFFALSLYGKKTFFLVSRQKLYNVNQHSGKNAFVQLCAFFAFFLCGKKTFFCKKKLSFFLVKKTVVSLWQKPFFL